MVMANKANSDLQAVKEIGLEGQVTPIQASKEVA